MKATQFFVSTLKEAPADAEVTSHKLMTRAGMIKKLGAGIYNYMPMGLRVIRKVEAIVREEMNRAGAVELSMPVVQPAELWEESGRFSKMGPELLRLKDQPRPRLRDAAHLRGGDHRHRAPGAAQLQAAAEELLPDPDQVPRRAPSALRHHARARVHDEGRVLVRPRRGSRHRELRRDAQRLPRHLRPLRPEVPRRRGRFRRDRRRPVRGVPGHRRHRRGRDRLLPQLRLRRQHRGWPKPLRWSHRAAPPRPRWRRRRRRARAPAPTSPRCWACRWIARSSRWCSPPTSWTSKGDVVQDHRVAAAAARRSRHERSQGRQDRWPEGRLPLRDRRPRSRITSAPSPATWARSA